MLGASRLAWTKPLLLATALVFVALADASAAPCGNGILQGGEQCDQGALNGTPGSCCTATCTFRASAEQCRTAGGVCDAAEFCTGASPTCPADALVTAGVECRAAAGTCDTPEFCTGASAACPTDVLAPADTECREAQGVCDVVELCSGSSAQCPTDLVATIGTPCGDGSDSDCDNADTCDGAGSCVANHEPPTTECRGAASACDVAEFCDGAGACPSDEFAAVETACGDGSDTACSAPDRCDGEGTCLANHEPPTTECRGAAGTCDVAEFCDGAGSCPADEFAAAGAACGDGSETPCNAPDSCDGSGSCLANFAPPTTPCREAAGECDVAELCDGAGSCPSDAFAVAGAACGDGSASSCDAPDSCDGSGTCLANFAPPTTECRSSAGACDVAELCNGAGTCPEDGLAAAATVCRPVAGGCDVAESCTGADTACPPDDLREAGFECRSASGVCDVADTCTGDSPACADEFEPAGTLCRPDTGECDVAEACTGSSGSCPPDAAIRVDFDDEEAPETFAEAAPLTTQYAALGIVWQGAGAVVAEAALSGLSGQSPPNFAGYAEGEALLGGTSMSYDTMVLACPSKEVRFLVGAESRAVFVAEAFDAIGNPLDEVGVEIDPELRQLTLRAETGLITSVAYETFAPDEQEAPPGFVVDSVLVPEPALGTLAAWAALCLLGLRRAHR